MQIDMELYRFFYHTAKNGSISKASQELFVTQPAVSQSIKLLEEQLGVQLFHRSPQGVSLTEEGKRLYGPVEQAYFLLLEAQQDMAERRLALSGEISIGASDALGKHILLPRLKKFRSAHPNITIKLIHRTTTQTIRLLQEGKIDVAIVHMPIEQKKLTLKPITAIHDCFVMAPNFLPANAAPLSLQEIAKLPLLLLAKASRSRQLMDAYFQQYGVRLKPVMELASLELLIEFCKAGFGVACIAREYVETEIKEGELIEIRIEHTIPPREIGILVRSDQTLSSNVRHLLACFHGN